MAEERKKKILIVEDEPSLGGVLVGYMEKEGYEASLALTGDEGWQRAQSEKPDLVLLDIVMPVMDGWEFFRRLKELYGNSVPVIVVSNLGGSDDVKKGIEMGAVDYLVKANISLEYVVEKAKKALGET